MLVASNETFSAFFKRDSVEMTGTVERIDICTLLSGTVQTTLTGIVRTGPKQFRGARVYIHYAGMETFLTQHRYTGNWQ